MVRFSQVHMLAMWRWGGLLGLVDGEPYFKEGWTQAMWRWGDYWDWWMESHISKRGGLKPCGGAGTGGWRAIFQRGVDSSHVAVGGLLGLVDGEPYFKEEWTQAMCAEHNK